MEELVMKISGMTCGHCVAQVTKALEKLDGVQLQQVNLGSATVAYDSSRTSPEQLARAVEAAGYEVRPTPIAGASRAEGARTGSADPGGEP